MPFALVALVGLAGYSVISRNFQKFSKLSAILFMLLICGIVFVNVETLFRVSDYFNRNDYINLADEKMYIDKKNRKAGREDSHPASGL